jgi:hypothetical protein
VGGDPSLDSRPNPMLEAGMTAQYKKLQAILPILLLGTILTAGWWLTPGQVEGWPLCLFKYLTHLDCPGCGLTRSFLAMARLDVTQAVKFNAAGPLLYLFFVFTLVERAGALFDSQLKRRVRWPRFMAVIFSSMVVFLLIGHWIFRVKNQVIALHFFQLISITD